MHYLLLSRQFREELKQNMREGAALGRPHRVLLSYRGSRLKRLSRPLVEVTHIQRKAKDFVHLSSLSSPGRGGRALPSDGAQPGASGQ